MKILGIETLQEQQQDRRRRRPFRHLAHHLEAMLGAGLLVMLPIGITLLVLKFFFGLLDPILGPLLAKFLPGPYIIGSGLVALIIAVYLIGLIASHVVGRRLIEWGHLLIERIPLVKIIYSTTRSSCSKTTNRILLYHCDTSRSTTIHT